MANQSSPSQSFPGAIRILRIAGIDVFLHWSWAVVAILELQFRKGVYDSQVWNILEYLSIFAIVLLHEFGHALACRSVGGQADRILLWPLGGIAYVNPPRRPGAVLWSIAAGPLVNVLLLPVTLGASLYVDILLPGASEDLVGFIDMIATINLVLLVFNIMPVYPLDGGQIVQAILWFFIGQHRSLTVAASIGLAAATGGIVLAAYAGQWWLMIMAIFLASRSWQGLKYAKALSRLLALQRRTGPRCPACHEAPPIGAFWRCGCGMSFDTFVSGGVCPTCLRAYDVARCPFCGRVAQFDRWEMPFTPATIVQD